MRFQRLASLARAKFAVALIVAGAGVYAHPQSPNDLSAFVGRWQINPGKSRLMKYGPHGKNELKSNTYTFVFTPAGPGLTLSAYNEYPQSAPSRSIAVILDRNAHPCTGICVVPGVQPGQTYTFFPIDSHFIARTTDVKGKTIEFLTYAVSSDGKTLTMTTSTADTPEWQSSFVFEKQP
jgi:hypothetical protein